jgi:hypothetical protein
MDRKFEISGQWMKACGKGDQPLVVPVKSIETNMIGGKGFDALLTVTMPDGREWQCFAARGRFID